MQLYKTKFSNIAQHPKGRWYWCEDVDKRIAELDAKIERLEGAKKEGAINIILDGPPGPEAGRFVEIETDDGKSISIGTWSSFWCGEAEYWGLRIPGNGHNTQERVDHE